MNFVKPTFLISSAGVGMYWYYTYSRNKVLIDIYEEITGHKFKLNYKDKYKLYLKYDLFENFNEPDLPSTKNYFIHGDRLSMKSLLYDGKYIDRGFIKKFLHNDDIIITREELNNFSSLDPFFTKDYYKFMYKVSSPIRNC